VTRRGEGGFSIVMLVAAITIMMIGMAVAVPSWQHVIQDDKEQELIFRGGQIADAIQSYQRKNGNALPATLEVLVKGKFLRKAYKDPMVSDGQWRFIRQGEATGGAVRPPGVPGGPSPSPSASPTTASPQTVSTGTGLAGSTLGPFVGVASRSKKKSLRIFNNAKSYDMWLFIAGQPRVVGKAPTIGGPGLVNAPGSKASPTPPSSPTPLPPPGATQ
jgi:type II secretory pathway pseudopilin PulG